MKIEYKDDIVDNVWKGVIPLEDLLANLSYLFDIKIIIEDENGIF